MAAMTRPISTTEFVNAIKDLPVSSLSAKARELRNAIKHLEISNVTLQLHADKGDDVCAEALTENIEVIGRMRKRLTCLRAEVECRGLKWDNATSGTEEGVSDLRTVPEIARGSSETGDQANESFTEGVSF